MRLRPPLLTLFMLTLGAAPAPAMDLQGKWGLGVGAGGVVSTSSDITVFRGRSATSGWLLDLVIDGSNATGHANVSLPDTSQATQALHQNTNSSDFSVRVAPGIRHFLIANGPFSPYLDFNLLVDYARMHNYTGYPGGFNRLESTTWSFGAGAAMGAEYLTPWHFSLSAHTQIGQVLWSLTDNTGEVALVPAAHFKSDVVHARALIQPVLELRVYF